MTVILPDNERLIHLACDPQHRFLPDPNSSWRAIDSYLGKLRDFCDELYEQFGIKTLILGYDVSSQKFQFCNAEQTSRLQFDLPLRSHEKVFEKGHPNAF